MKELRCSCNKLLGKTSTQPIKGVVEKLEENNVKSPHYIRMWCTRCKKEVEFKI